MSTSNEIRGGFFVHTMKHCYVTALYSATREDDTTFIFSHFGLFLSDAASNLHK